jgi:class 3 adenylate cyclase
VVTHRSQQEEIKRFTERLRAEKGLNLQVRVGANSGEVVVRSIIRAVQFASVLRSPSSAAEDFRPARMCSFTCGL